MQQASIVQQSCIALRCRNLSHHRQRFCVQHIFHATLALHLRSLFGVLAGFACLGTNSKPVTKLHMSHSTPPALTSIPSAHHQHCMQGRSDSCIPVPLHAPEQVLFPGSDIGRVSDQQQQGTVLHLPEQHSRAAGQISLDTGHLQQQQQQPQQQQQQQQFGSSASQQGCGQMSQLFSQAEMLDDDLKAYAALVHAQQAVSRYVEPGKSCQVVRMRDHCKEQQLLRPTPGTSAL